MTRPRGARWPGIPRARGIDDYVPGDHAQRAESHQAFAGEADGWPIPLTRVGQPASGRHRVLTRRPRGRETILSTVAEAPPQTAQGQQYAPTPLANAIFAVLNEAP